MDRVRPLAAAAVGESAVGSARRGTLKRLLRCDSAEGERIGEGEICTKVVGEKWRHALKQLQQKLAHSHLYLPTPINDPAALTLTGEGLRLLEGEQSEPLSDIAL